MSLWEYKVITSGRGGFATPALLEKFLNDLGRDEWEIIHFQTLPDNSLAFTGMARRSTQRDWTLEDAAAAAARTEAEKLRAEFEAKFKSVANGAPALAADEKPTSLAAEKLASDDGMRRLRDTTRDGDPESDDEDSKDEWDKLSSEDELPTFFDSIRPHMRRNQRGPGMSVGVEHLAKKWNLSEDDVKGALVECGFPIPEDEDDKPVYHEYEGDLYWLNVNRRGELWLNTKEKPRPIFRTVQATRVSEPVEEVSAVQPAVAGPASSADVPAPPKREMENREANRDAPVQRAPDSRNQGRREQSPGAQPTASVPAPLPTGNALLDKIRPLMRRNRQGTGGSGSTSFLSRGLKTTEADLLAAFAALGLAIPAGPGDKPVYTAFGQESWWVSRDSRGGVWINGREREVGDKAEAELPTAPATVSGPAPSLDPPTPAEEAPTSTPGPELPPVETQALFPKLDSQVATAPGGEWSGGVPATLTSASLTEVPPPAPDPSSVLAGVRLLLKEGKTGSFSAKVEKLAQDMGKSPDEVLATLAGAGLKVPEKAREKPVFAEHAGEIFWLNKNAKDELWLNAKASKFPSSGEAGDDGAKKSAPRSRSRKKTGTAVTDESVPAQP